MAGESGARDEARRAGVRPPQLEHVGREAYVGPPGAPLFTRPARSVEPGDAWTEGDSTRWLRSLHDDANDLAVTAGAARRAEASAAGRPTPVPSGLPEVDALLGGLLPEVTVLTASDPRLRLALAAGFGAVTEPVARRSARGPAGAAPRPVRVLGTTAGDAADLRIALSVARLGASQATVLAGGKAYSVSDSYGVLTGPRDVGRLPFRHAFEKAPAPAFRGAALTPRLHDAEGARGLARSLEEEGALLEVLVVHDADERSARDGSEVLPGWRAVARELGVPVVLVVSGRAPGWADPADAHIDFVRQLASTRHPSRMWFLARGIPARGAATPASTFVYDFEHRAAGEHRGDLRSATASYELDAVWVPERGFDGEFDLRPAALGASEIAQWLAGRVPPPTRLLTMHDLQDALAIAMLHAPYVGEPLHSTDVERVEDLVLAIGARRSFALHLVFVANGWLTKPVAQHLARHRRLLLPVVGGRGCPGWARAMLRGEATSERWAHRPFVMEREDDDPMPSRMGALPDADGLAMASASAAAAEASAEGREASGGALDADANLSGSEAGSEGREGGAR